jgi:hypothetical protein
MRHQVNKRAAQAPIRNIPEALEQFERSGISQELLRRFGVFRGVPIDTGKQAGYRNFQHVGNLHKAARTDAVCSFFVFLHLLERHADALSESGLRELRSKPVDSNIFAHNPVRGLGSASRHADFLDLDGINWIAPTESPQVRTLLHRLRIKGNFPQSEMR